MTRKRKKIPLHTRIFIGMIAGIVAGIILKNSAGFLADFLNTALQPELPFTPSGIIKNAIIWVQPIGDIFLRFIFMMVIPLIISALTLGIADLGDLSRLGRIGWKMLRYTLVVTSISVALGITFVTVFQPGNSLSVAERESITAQFSSQVQQVQTSAQIAKDRNIGDIITSIIPKNPWEEMSRAFEPGYMGGGLLSIMFFALVLGIALTVADQEKVQTFKSFLVGLYEIVMKVIHFAMQLAPLGVAALLFVLTINLGSSILLVLLKYVLVVISALAVHQFITYSIILKYFAGTSPLKFFKDIREVMITAFSTSSSNATLPIAIKATIENLKLRKDIGHFVLTIGSTANQNGTALYEGITVLFLAQCFGVDLGIAEQITVVFICILAGVGTAGVPGGSLPVIMLILESVGIPGGSIALIYGVDRILDMSRTVLNVTGDITAAVYINHSENKYYPENEIVEGSEL